MRNPWEEIDLDAYEKHMSLASVMQLQTMNAMMKDQFTAYDVRTAMVLGIAGGNGLEHVEEGMFDALYGVDINEYYLYTASKRYEHLGDMLKLVHLDLLDESDKLPGAELVIANLLVEYTGYPIFKKVIDTISPKYVSCAIQVNTDDAEWVSDSPYSDVFDGLEAVSHQLDENGLTEAMEEIGYKRIKLERNPLPNGKMLVRLDYELKDFPEFMKSEANHIDSSQQNTPDIDGYYYEGADGGQICFWTYQADRDSRETVHEFDEYVFCVAGEYVEVINGEEHILHSGDELLIPKGAPHYGRVKKGTRTIHAFGGKRIK